MTRPYDHQWHTDGDTGAGHGGAAQGGQVNAGTISGGQFSFGSGNNVQGAVPPARGAAERPDQVTGGSPVSSLYAFGDIVSYSQLNARQQSDSQSRLVRVLNGSLIEAGVRPDTVQFQDQGDARFLRFPASTDVAKVLALMPPHLNSDLLARNQDLAQHARMRVRLSFVMGAATSGSTGLAGSAPIEVVRLANSAKFRRVMNAASLTHCGVIVDDYLYTQFVRQPFRPDMSPEEYIAVHVSDPDKGFAAGAWIRLFGYTRQQVIALIR